MTVGEARVPLLHEEKTVNNRNADRHQSDGGQGSAGQQSRSAGVLTSLAAGAAAGAIAKTTIAPLDRTKINFQVSQTPYSWRAAVKFLADSVHAEGVKALWRGNSATMARIVPYAAIQFTAHEQWKRALGVHTPRGAKEQPVRHLIAGSLAGVTSQSATYPLDLARARMAVGQWRTMTSVFKHILEREGVGTLYRGYTATVLGVVPYAGFSFFTYDSLKHKYLEIYHVPASGMVNLLFGGAAGAVGQTASYPLDIVRRRMQTAQRHTQGAEHYSSIRGTLRYVYSTEGWRGFFKGLSMNWVKGPAAVGISFATYDYIKLLLTDISLKLHAS